MGEKNFLDEAVDAMVEEIGGIKNQFKKEVPYGLESASLKQGAKRFASFQTDEQRTQFIEKVGLDNVMKMAAHIQRNRERV